MLIKFLRGTVATPVGEKTRPVKEGEVLDIIDKEARPLVLSGKAVPQNGAAPAPAAPVATPTPPPAPNADTIDGAGDGDDLNEPDPDLEGEEGEEDDLPTDYQALCEIALGLRIEKPSSIKKSVLIEQIKEARKKAAA